MHIRLMRERDNRSANTQSARFLFSPVRCSLIPTYSHCANSRARELCVALRTSCMYVRTNIRARSLGCPSHARANLPGGLRYHRGFFFRYTLSIYIRALARRSTFIHYTRWPLHSQNEHARRLISFLFFPRSQQTYRHTDTHIRMPFFWSSTIRKPNRILYTLYYLYSFIKLGRTQSVSASIGGSRKHRGSMIRS